MQMEQPSSHLDDPLAEVWDLEHELQALLDQKSLGKVLSSATIASVRSVANQAAHGSLLSDLCADVLQGVDAPERTARKRPRRLVDSVMSGPQVSRWNSVADASAEQCAAMWSSRAEADAAAEAPKQTSCSARPDCAEAEQTPQKRRGKTFTGTSLRQVLARGGRGRHVSMQVQALLVHGYTVLGRLSSTQRCQLLHMLPPAPMRPQAARHTSVPAQILARLLGMSARTIDNHIGFVRRKGAFGKRPTVVITAGGSVPMPSSTVDDGVPAEAVAEGSPSVAGPLQHGVARATPSVGLVNLVRVTQFMSTHGLPKALLPNLAYLILAAKGDVGTSRHNRRFASVAEAAADSLLTRQARAWLNQPLGGTGRLPDLEVFCDAGSIGQYYSRANDQVFAIALVDNAERRQISADMIDCFGVCVVLTSRCIAVGFRQCTGSRKFTLDPLVDRLGSEDLLDHSGSLDRFGDLLDHSVRR